VLPSRPKNWKTYPSKCQFFSISHDNYLALCCMQVMCTCLCVAITLMIELVFTCGLLTAEDCYFVLVGGSLLHPHKGEIYPTGEVLDFENLYFLNFKFRSAF